MNRLKQFVAGTLMASTALSSAAATFVGDRTDFRDETIYFAMTTRFYDGDPKNNVLCWDGVEDQVKNNDPCWRGDFKGLIEKLDYIKALGFTAIWITPIVQNASGFDYHGYHAMDFSRVDLRYESRTEWGSAEDVKFEDLIREAHDRDMKVILDIVLQHTGNFGEDTLCHLFDRDQDIRNQAKIEACMIPDGDRLGGDSYWDLDPNTQQYPTRFKYLKNTDGQNHDDKNYYHHVANAWNWDEPSRWWGQIAGDCVDLNTENPAVDKYLVDCYGKFIEMGLDGFRIDTTGHIAPLTFNSYFIPKFIELGEKHKDKRKGDTPFYMFGECCARYGSVIYRDHHVLSSHYYTWKSDPSLVNEWNTYTADWWAQQVVPEGADILGNMVTCTKDAGTVHNSKNVFMQNGAWHDPDYSQASGFNVIDFPMHYNFNNAGAAVNIAREGDHYYNDASWNVVYVDSHDYCPGPNDGTRFSGGTSQWAENLSLMFTFRGIPCIYYGSEVEFQKGVTIDEGPKLALANSGRAYFGEYLKGSVEATDFAEYTADGNVAKTLNGDLSQHIRRLNQIRAAVPALRKGQYTFDGCSANGGFAYKRAWKDSYALVALNGGATFTDVPAGTYTDIVTGKTYNVAGRAGGSITVDAPHTQGQLRVLVKDWTGGQVGEHGKFIYDQSPVNHGGAVSFTDSGTTEYYTREDAVGAPAVTFSPGSTSFKTETLSVKVALNEVAVSGWYKVGDQAQVNLTSGQEKTLTLGADMAFGETVTVTWGVKGANGKEYTGSNNYRKLDPNAVITIYVTAPSAPGVYMWSEKQTNLNGAWPGNKPTEVEEIDGKKFWSVTTDAESVNVIFTNGGNQTADITGITETTFFEYDGGTNYKILDNVDPTPQPSVSFSPNGGTFDDTLTVKATAKNASSASYKVGDEAEKFFTTDATFTIDGDMQPGESVNVTWTATYGDVKKTGTVKYTKKAPRPAGGITIYVTAPSVPGIYIWDAKGAPLNGAWPGNTPADVEEIDGRKFWSVTVDADKVNVIFNNSGSQTGNIEGITETSYFEYDGSTYYKRLENIDVTPQPTVTFSPNGGTFDDTLTVKATAKNATSASYKVGNEAEKSFTNEATFTIGGDMQPGESVNVTWTATNGNVTKSGTVKYTKKASRPTSGITVYVAAAAAPHVYMWNDGGTLNGNWPGDVPTESEEIDGVNYWYVTTQAESFNVIFNMGDDATKTADIKDITETTYFTYDGRGGYKKVENVVVVAEPKVTMSPNGATFDQTQTVKLTVTDAESAWYKIGNAAQVAFTNETTITLGEDMEPGQSVVVSWSATKGDVTKTGEATFTKRAALPVTEGLTVYVKTKTGQAPNLHFWGDGVDGTEWPGVTLTNKMNVEGDDYYYYTFPEGVKNVSIVINGNNKQTNDIPNIHKNTYFSFDDTSDDRANNWKEVTFGGNSEDPDPNVEYIYFDNKSNWAHVYIYAWEGAHEYFGGWPGKELSEMIDYNGKSLFYVQIPNATLNTMIIFNNGDKEQTGDMNYQEGGVYDNTGYTDVDLLIDALEPEYYTLQGVRVSNPLPGVYIMRRGRETKKVVIR